MDPIAIDQSLESVAAFFKGLKDAEKADLQQRRQQLEDQMKRLRMEWEYERLQNEKIRTGLAIEGEKRQREEFLYKQDVDAKQEQMQKDKFNWEKEIQTQNLGLARTRTGIDQKQEARAEREYLERKLRREQTDAATEEVSGALPMLFLEPGPDGKPQVSDLSPEVAASKRLFMIKNALQNRPMADVGSIIDATDKAFTSLSKAAQTSRDWNRKEILEAYQKSQESWEKGYQDFNKSQASAGNERVTLFGKVVLPDLRSDPTKRLLVDSVLRASSESTYEEQFGSRRTKFIQYITPLEKDPEKKEKIADSIFEPLKVQRASTEKWQDTFRGSLVSGALPLDAIPQIVQRINSTVDDPLERYKALWALLQVYEGIDLGKSKRPAIASEVLSSRWQKLGLMEGPRH